MDYEKFLSALAQEDDLHRKLANQENLRHSRYLYRMSVSVFTGMIIFLTAQGIIGLSDSRHLAPAIDAVVAGYLAAVVFQLRRRHKRSLAGS